MPIKDYITLYIDSKIKNKEDYAFFKEQSMSIKNNMIKITYSSAVLEECLNDLKGKLERFLSAAGFSYLKIEYIYLEPEDTVFDYEKDKEEYDNLLAKFKKMKAVEEEEKKKASLSEKKVGAFPSRPSFKNKTFTRVELDQIPRDVVDIEVEAKVFDVIPEGKSGKRYKINFTNFKTSYTARIWTNKTYTSEYIKGLNGKWVTLQGTLSYNQFDKEDSLDLFKIELLDKVDPVRTDDAEVKRVELHAHTNMSAMDGICDVRKLVSQAAKWGHKAVAITDHVAVQSFPDAQREQAALKKKGMDIKVLYGIELNVAPRLLEIANNPSNIDLKDATYVFFDLETTGLSCVFDDIIEFGAVKAKNGVEIDRIDILINPGRKISEFTTNLTGITNEMLADKKTIDEELPRIVEFLGDAILVAHNASFDIGFLQQVLKRWCFGAISKVS